MKGAVACATVKVHHSKSRERASIPSANAGMKLARRLEQSAVYIPIILKLCLLTAYSLVIGSSPSDVRSDRPPILF